MTRLKLVMALMAVFLAQPLAAQESPYPLTAQETYRDAPRAIESANENVSFAWADVLRVDPVYEYVRSAEPREECYDQRVERREPRGGDPTGGTVLGAIIGGAIGNKVGRGDGRTGATVAGAVIGGSIGHNVDRNNGPGRNYAATERRCRWVTGGREVRQINGYDVEYRFRGEVYMSRLDYDPGERLRVRVSVAPAD